MGRADRRSKNDANFTLALPDDDSIGANDEQSLSFSSSSGEDSASSPPLHVAINDGGQERVTIESLKQFFSGSGHHRDESNISTSVNSLNTAVISNRSPTRRGNTGQVCSVFEEATNKRSIFGKQAARKYNVRHKEPQRSPLSELVMESLQTPDHNVEYSPNNGTNHILSTPPRTPCTPDIDNESSHPKPPLQTVGYQSIISPNLSPLTPAQATNDGRRKHMWLRKISDEEESSIESGAANAKAVRFDPAIGYSNDDPTPPNCAAGHGMPHGDSYHAQALLLSIAFFFIWTPQNLLAPNLTQAAFDFGYGDDTRARDLYLGSNLALASSVLSLPVSAFIGFASDIVSSRRTLIALTTFIGGMAAIATGLSTNYRYLILSRFISGACMSGSVPVVFSLLSDWFDEKDRNAASSGFTAAMGAGILAGQVYAGCGPTAGWRHSFFTSGIITMSLAVVILVCVREPVRGGKEKVLQEMLERGGKYEKKLTWDQFVSSMANHPSNSLLMLHGFFSNIPWGVMFVFLNDFLSQEKGLAVESATFIVAVFGVGSAVGGILGGYLGSLASRAHRGYLPLFMSLTTALGILPFLLLLSATFDHAGFTPCFYAFAGGCLASMPSVNVRPCIINCNPPEMRGAALTSANLVVNAARGAGPSFLTAILMGVFGFNRAYGFYITIVLFWAIASIQLAFLSRTLPADQAKMETELAQYVQSSMDVGYGSISAEDSTHGIESYYEEDATFDGDRSLFSIENQATSFDAVAARQSLEFVRGGMREIIADGLSFCSANSDGQWMMKQPPVADFQL